MAHKKFDEELDAFDPNRGIENSRTPPFTWYTDQEFYEQEVARIFQRVWCPVGRTDQVAKQGQYFTGELVGNPYVVTRADDDRLYAHHNVCRHKGAIVAQQEDEDRHSCAAFQCPFHGWQYELNGRLKSAPMLGPQKSFEREDYGLKPISVDTWGPFVFLDLDGPYGGENNPRALTNDIKELSEHLDMSNLRFHQRKVYEMNCNWKVFVDNSLDGGYHVKWAHETLAGGLDLKQFETKVFKRSSVQLCQTNGHDTRLGDKVAYAYLFPNLFINRYGNMMDVNIVEPISVDRCRVIFDFYFDYDNFEEWAARKKMRQEIAASHSIQQEDIAICESTQRGMNSMSWKWGRYSSILEQACYGFHSLLWYELRGMTR
jgi:choline monooxygenase